MEPLNSKFRKEKTKMLTNLRLSQSLVLVLEKQVYSKITLNEAHIWQRTFLDYIYCKNDA